VAEPGDFPDAIERAVHAGLVVDELKKRDVRPRHVEGMSGGRWVLIDYIDFVVHVFHPEARMFYQLENLWGDAPRWNAPEA